MRRTLQCFSISWIFLLHSPATVNSFKINYSCHPSWIVVCGWKVTCVCKTAQERAHVNHVHVSKPRVSCLFNTNDFLTYLYSVHFNMWKKSFFITMLLFDALLVWLEMSLLTCIKGLADVARLRYSQIKLSQSSWIHWVFLLKNQRQKRALELLLKNLIKQY